MPYATHESPLIGHAHYGGSADMDLCDLLQTMSLSSIYAPHGKAPENTFHVVPQRQPYMGEQSVEVSMAIEEPVMHVQPEAGPSQTSKPSLSIPQMEDEYPGCGFLQAIRAQIEEYQTTGGEYLESIFTHREIMNSYPAGHKRCSRAFTEISSVLEKRVWRSDRESDNEAVIAFRHEAWFIWSALAAINAGHVSARDVPQAGSSSMVCSIPMM